MIKDVTGSSVRRPELIPAHRRALVLEHIKKRGGASIQELADAIGTSHSTIRRDLEHLEEKGYLERAHGGALLQRTSHSTFEPEAAIAAEFSKVEKLAIGQTAALTLNRGDSVIFDSSSTVLAAAQAVVDRGIGITAVTNDLGIAQVLTGEPKIRVVVPGGSIRPGSMTLIGEPGQDFIKNIHADVAFIGTHAISAGILTETSLELAAMKRAMISAARRVILLADSSKFQPPAFCRICSVDALHEVITDSGAAADQVRELRDLGVKVSIAAVGSMAGQTL